MSHFSRRHFHDIDIRELIHKYKQYDCLWNYNSPNYKSKSLKQEAWQEISNYFKKDANEVKRKIKYLRSAYVSEKRRVNASRKSETPHKPSLFYYHDLNFLDNIVVLRKYESDTEHTNIEFENANISQDTEDNEELVHFENEEDIIDLRETETNCKVETLTESELEQSLSLQKPISNSPKIIHARSLARPVKRKISGEIKPNKSVPTRNESLVSSDKPQCKNLYISFGKTIALQLQQLPLEVAILAMSEIHTILTTKTLEHIRSLRKCDLSSSHSESEDSCSLIEEYFDDSS